MGTLWAPFCGLGLKKSAEKSPKDDVGGIAKTSIFLCVFACFQRLEVPIGAPNDGLEASLGPTWGSWEAIGAYLT
jgi:hypothetical protein